MDGFDSIVTMAEAKKLKRPAVYVFLDNGEPVYVGKTTNLYRRFESYCSNNCHNSQLNEFLFTRKNQVEVGLYFDGDIDSLEIDLIKRYKSKLFNIAYGTENAAIYQSTRNKPWIAKRGVLCPSSLILGSIKDKSKKVKIRDWLRGLCDYERSIVEVDFAMQIGKRAEKWGSYVAEKMIKELSSHG